MGERKASGESIRGFCERTGIRRHQYFYWQRKLREAACKHLKPLQDAQKSLVAPGFAQVMASEEIAGTSPEASGQLRISVGEVQIATDATYPPEKLAALLRGLGRC
jgi:hypothetical protein